MEDSRDIPKDHGGTEAERIAAEAAAEAGWRWPRVRMMAQSPDLQGNTPIPSQQQQQQQQQKQQQQQQQEQPKQRSTWSQVRRFVSEVTEVFDDCDSKDPLVGPSAATAADTEHARFQHPAAWIVAAWAMLVAIDWALTTTTMPRAVAWVSAQPWAFALDLPSSFWFWANDALAWVQMNLVEISVAMTHPFAAEWLCFCVVSAVVLIVETNHSHKRGSERAWVWLAYAVLSLVADMALAAVLGPPATDRKGRACEPDSSSAGCGATLAGAADRRAQRLQLAAADQNPAAGEWRGIALLATVAMYVAAGLQLRVRSGVRLRVSAALLAADLGFRRFSGASAALMGQSARHLAEHVIVISALLSMREAAVAVQAMRSWHAAVVRERRRGGPLMVMQESAGKTVSRLTVGGAYTHRVCFLCLSGYCERCLLSMEIWPTTANSGSSADRQPEALSLESPGSDSQPAFDADLAAEALPVSPTRPVAPVLAAGRRRVRKHGRTAVAPATAVAAEQAALVSGLPLVGDVLPTLGLLNPPAPAAATGSRRGRTIDMWIISSVAHCPCRSVHGPGPSAFVSKAQGSVNDGRSDSRFTMPVGSVVGLAQYVAELRSLGLVRPVNATSASQSDDFTASVFPYIFGRFAVPAHRVPVAAAAAAANALTASNPRASGHTPATAPVLAAVPAAEQSRVSRILMASTPLSLARNAESGGTFRLNAVALLGRTENYGGCVLVSVVMTPALAHLLLSHPKSAPTTAVCVPAALLSSAKTADSAAVVSDADPFLDYTVVQVARSDVVVRVNGARWMHYELGSSALNQPIAVSHLPVDVSPQPLAISVSICGMRSEDLSILIDSAKAATAVDAPVGELSVAVDKDQELVAEAEAEKARLATVTQSLKRAKREAPKTVAHWEAQLETMRKSLDRNAAAEAKLESKHRHLEMAVGALRTTVQALTEESVGNHEGDSTAASSDNHQVVDDALRILRASEAEARKQRDAHARAMRELDAERTAWKASLSDVVRETDPLEKALMDPLQRELRDVSRKFLVARNVEAKLQAKLQKELEACNDLAKDRPVAKVGSGDLAGIKKSIAKEKAEISWLSKM